MHVVFVLPRFHPYPGGYENLVLWLARRLREDGHSVTVLTTTAYDLESFWLPGFRTLPPGSEDLAGINIVRLPISYARWSRRAGRLLGFVPYWRWQAQFARPSFHVPGLSAYLRSLRGIDVIHVGPLPYNRLLYQGIQEARRRRCRVIATPCTHFGEEDNSQVAQHYTQPFQVQLLNQCDAVLALTSMERDRLVQAGVAKQKITATGAGIDPAEVTGGNASRFRDKYGITGAVVLHLGTKARDKGSITVLEAMQQLWASGSQAWLVMAGSSLSEFDQFLRGQQVRSGKLLNLSFVSDEEKRDLLAATTILVHPSRVESLGLVYLEAWENAKPVIAADTPVSREVVAGENDGLLVPFGDSEALAGAIQRLLQNQQLCEFLGRNGQKKVQNRFSSRAALDRIYPFFQAQSAGAEKPSV
jgi:glycosyltransferase involved in cell wall biosynthesis